VVSGLCEIEELVIVVNGGLGYSAEQGKRAGRGLEWAIRGAAALEALECVLTI
jgi:hypothetical protein